MSKILLEMCKNDYSTDSTHSIYLLVSFSCIFMYNCMCVACRRLMCTSVILIFFILDTYWTNPQYRVHVVDADDEDDEDAGTVIVGLMQKERRKKMKEGLGLLTLGYSIYKVSP